MSLTDAPPIITSLDTQLRACASFPGAATTWYPDAPEGTTGTHFILTRMEPQRDRYAEGAAALLGGELRITGHIDTTVGAAETLCDDLLEQLLAQATGIAFRGGTGGLCGKSGRAKTAAGHAFMAFEINLQYGLKT